MNYSKTLTLTQQMQNQANQAGFQAGKNKVCGIRNLRFFYL